MKLRTQLLVINLISVALLVGAVVYSYSLMLLNLRQTQLLTLIAVGAGLLSSLAYWLMTIPMMQSMQKLMEFTQRVGNGTFEAAPMDSTGPYEIRQLTQSIWDMNQKLHNSFHSLETMERTRRELIANVTHDLRTPIATVQSFVEALDDGVIDNRETSQVYLRTIHREVGRLSSLIDDLFELSKLEGEKPTFHPIPSYIDSIILDVLESCSVRIADKKLNVTVQITEDAPLLDIMPEKITRVVSNLVDNAIRHSPPDSDLKVQLTPLPSQDFVEVSIRDEGEGIAEEYRDEVFERFFRTDPSRQRASGGTGLGLAIARSLVHLHGGQIGVRPSNGGLHGNAHGSEFWFTLPIHKRDETGAVNLTL